MPRNPKANKVNKIERHGHRRISDFPRLRRHDFLQKFPRFRQFTRLRKIQRSQDQLFVSSKNIVTVGQLPNLTATSDRF